MTAGEDAEMKDNGSPHALSPGKALAVTRVLPSLYLLGLVLAWFAPKDFGFGVRPVVYVGLSLGFVGMVLWIGSMIQMGKALAVLPGSDRLITSGVFRYVRHPVYVGITVTFLGVFLAIGSTVGMIYLGAIVVPLNLFRARWEEKALMGKYGEAYQAYRKQTWF